VQWLVNVVSFCCGVSWYHGCGTSSIQWVNHLSKPITSGKGGGITWFTTNLVSECLDFSFCVCFLMLHMILSQDKRVRMLILECMYCMTNKKKIHKNNKTPHCATHQQCHWKDSRMIIPPHFAKSHAWRNNLLAFSWMFQHQKMSAVLSKHYAKSTQSQIIMKIPLYNCLD
jgi:hypothetical protein